MCPQVPCQHHHAIRRQAGDSMMLRAWACCALGQGMGASMARMPCVRLLRMLRVTCCSHVAHTRIEWMATAQSIAWVDTQGC